MIRLPHSCHSWRSGVGPEILVTPLTEFDPFSDLGVNNPLSLRFAVRIRDHLKLPDADAFLGPNPMPGLTLRVPPLFVVPEKVQRF
jgi:hypothetical protein